MMIFFVLVFFRIKDYKVCSKSTYFLILINNYRINGLIFWVKQMESDKSLDKQYSIIQCTKDGIFAKIQHRYIERNMFDSE